MRKFAFLLAVFVMASFATAESTTQTRISGIQVEGLRWTRSDYIARLLDVHVGQLVEEGDVRRMAQRLENTGRFRAISVTLEELSPGESVVRIHCEDQFPYFAYPWGSYNSYSGFSGMASFSDSNLTGNLDSLSVSANIGWNPKVESFPKSITAYGLSVSYNARNLPGFERWSFSSNFNLGMYSSRRLDGQGAYVFWYDANSLSAGLSAAFRIQDDLVVTPGIAATKTWNTTVVADNAIPVSPDAVTCTPSISLTYDRMNSFDMGASLEGWRAAVNESPSFDFTAEKLSSQCTVGMMAAFRPWPIANVLLRGQYQNCIGTSTSIGGYYTYLRGFQASEVTTDNAIILNNENRLKLADNFLWGRISLAVFEDLCWSFDAFDFPGSRLLVGAGIGARYRSNALGTTFKIDIAWKLANPGQFPEIVFTMGELVQ